jgi:hypothetical protein
MGTQQTKNRAAVRDAADRVSAGGGAPGTMIVRSRVAPAFGPASLDDLLTVAAE